MHDTILVLIHGFEWTAKQDIFLLLPEISLCKYSGSTTEVLYEKLCENTGLDDGSPFWFKVYISVNPKKTGYDCLEFGAPYSLLDRACNIIAIAAGSPLGLCRLIHKRDSQIQSELNLIPRGQTEFWGGNSSWPTLNDEICESIVLMWKTATNHWEKHKAPGRLNNALTYFYYSWRSHYMDQICINLSIVLEILFAPHSNTETSHQIAFNVSRFFTHSRSSREKTYDLVKKFYSHRSTIVHGGRTDEKRLIDMTVPVFKLVTCILKRILEEPSLAGIFDDEEQRREMFRQYLFE
ncbi:MAG: hypothetical protein HY291_17990 [Planctomycetes bacterium]|nr:hypothetical protein [Planctomycetota bacterium]